MANDSYHTGHKTNAKLKWVETEKVMKVIAKCSIKKDSEIFINYGRGFREKI